MRGRMEHKRIFLGVVSGMTLLLAGCSFFQKQGVPAAVQGTFGYQSVNSEEAAAKVDGKAIAWREVKEGLLDRYYQLELQSYQLSKKRLDELIDERLIAVAAKREGIPVSEFVKNKIESQKTPVTDEDIHMFYEARKEKLPGDESSWTARIRDHLEQEHSSELRERLLEDLRKSADIQVYLKEPEAPRTEISVDSQPSKGPSNARVTIVEFSDYQCPYCARAEGVITNILAKYPNDVRLVYRDFPLTSIHPNAEIAAEAADCAYQLGGFWDYHGRLFQNQNKLSREDLGRYAEDVGLDPKEFAGCLDGGRGKPGVERDLREGTLLGITGTPTFYINGKMLSGAQPEEVFEGVIDKELASKR
jgi:protein-disulfide isomerase